MSLMLGFTPKVHCSKVYERKYFVIIWDNDWSSSCFTFFIFSFFVPLLNWSMLHLSPLPPVLPTVHKCHIPVSYPFPSSGLAATWMFTAPEQGLPTSKSDKSVAEESLQPGRDQVIEGWGKDSGALGMKWLHAGTYSAREAAARETAVTLCLAVIQWRRSIRFMANAKKKGLKLGNWRSSLRSDHESHAREWRSQDKWGMSKWKDLF